VLSQRYPTLKNPGNLNNEIGLPLSVLNVNEEHQRAVLEMGFYVPGEIRFLCEIAPPSIGVVTNIGQVHAERAGSQDAIARGKRELVESLPEDGWALLNADDPRVLDMAAHTEARVLTYGLAETAELAASDIHPRGLDGLDFTLTYKGEAQRFETPLLGRHSVYTALAAAAVGLVDGLDWDHIRAGLASPQGHLRMVARRTRQGALLLDDTYNASPQSTVAALDLLDDLETIEGRKIAVLGDMLELGPYEEEGHQRVGQHAAGIVDLLVTVGQRARMIASSAHKAGLQAAFIVEADHIEMALDYLDSTLNGSDAVLVKGSNALRMDRLIPMLEGKPEVTS
jgi:UDP-N-acetylmuramoyl-tripeptide--D-alanyl-D-alanine ligase